MYLTLEAWAHLSSATVAHCWAHTKILLQPPPALVGPGCPALSALSTVNSNFEEAMKELTMALNTLSVTVTQAKDLDISTAKEFISIQGENATMEPEWTDEDIVEQVKSDRNESGSKVEELLEPLPGTEGLSLLTLDEACQSIICLESFFCHRKDSDFLQAHVVLRHIWQTLEGEQM